MIQNLIPKDFIFYSTENQQSTIKRLDLKTGKIFEYSGSDGWAWFPNVELLAPVADDSFARFFYENIWYDVYFSEILKSGNQKQSGYKKTDFEEFRIK